MRSPALLGGCVLLTSTLLGCAGSPGRVALISHVVFVELDDPSDASAMLADADVSLRSIPGVSAYSAGRHIDVGRDSVLHDYEVGMVIGFDSLEDYAVYVDHPEHVAFVTRWKPRIARLRVYDIHDPAH